MAEDKWTLPPAVPWERRPDVLAAIQQVMETQLLDRFAAELVVRETFINLEREAFGYPPLPPREPEPPQLWWPKKGGGENDAD